MSSRKVPARTPKTGGKANAKPDLKTKPPTPKQQSKSSFNTTAQADTTFSQAGASHVPKLIAPDWTLQCDFEYSAYLRALLSKHIVQESLQSYEEAIDEQLSYQAELLRRTKQEVLKVENEIVDLKMKSDIEKMYSKLGQVSANVDELIRDYNVENNLATYIDSCEEASNRLYFVNIKPFKTQDDYDKFSLSVDKCTDTLKKLKTAIGNTEATQILGERLKKYVELRNSIEEKLKLVSDKQSDMNLLVLKTASDRFADFEEYNVE